jgi:hypothetical protein
VRRVGGLLALAPSGRGLCHARGDGFDLHAAVVVPPRDRARLERLCRYALLARVSSPKPRRDRREPRSAAARLEVSEALLRDFQELTPFPYRPFARSFDS